MAEAPHPPLRAVANHEDQVPALEASLWPLQQAPKVPEGSVVLVSPAPSLAEMTGLWGVLTIAQRRRLLALGRNMAEGER